MPSNHLILCHPLLLPSIFPRIRVSSSKSVLHIRWPKNWSFTFSISPSNEYSGLISFRIEWLDLFAVKKLWCWRRLLRVSWNARRSNQSIPKEISPGCSLEGLMLKLKLQYFGLSCEELSLWKRLWCWEGLGAGGEGDSRGWDGWMALLTQWTWVWVNSGSWWWTGKPGVLRFMRSQRVGHDGATKLN